VVDDVHGAAGDLDPVGEGIAHGVGTGEGRQQGGVGVDDPPAEGVDESRSEHAHEAGADDPIGGEIANRLRQGVVPEVTRREVPRRAGEAWNAGDLGPLERGAARHIAADRHHLSVEATVGAGIHERLQESAGAGRQHHKTSGHP